VTPHNRFHITHNNGIDWQCRCVPVPPQMDDPTPTVCPTCRGSGHGYALSPGPRCEGPPACRTCGGCGMVVEEVDDV
jgi:hypothetical protein